MKTKKASQHPHVRKRYGHHQKRSKQFHHVYLPYLPLVISIIASVLLSGWSPKTATLAYATNVSQGGLLQSTNSERASNGQASLALNQQLNSAAQAKANDMVARNYWSHNTPDGQEPWVFVNNAGYKYLKAGENLAYGFNDSSSTVTGWMNSPTHKANMLDSAFSEVGFGFANSEAYNGSGPETVVVAMYGKPQTLASTSQPTAPTAQPAAAQPTAQTAPAPAVEQPLEPAPAQATLTENIPQSTTPAFSTETAGLEPITVPVSRVESITKGQVPWAGLGVAVVIGLALAAILMKHGLAVRHLLRDSERFVIHHPLLDSTLIGLLVLGITLSQTVGFIR
ncbi:CAP domain-containing protein [Candidatus Saccharibacteria bacterium]|nr:CAP domain-containing protein [Candidatus Saccharibacteria bacterium]